MRETTTDTLVGDLIAGRADVAYATYVAYDEIAHHNGIADSASFRALKQLDKQFHRIEHATSYAPRPYQFVVLSDPAKQTELRLSSDAASIWKVS